MSVNKKIIVSCERKKFKRGEVLVREISICIHGRQCQQQRREAGTGGAAAGESAGEPCSDVSDGGSLLVRQCVGSADQRPCGGE